MASRLEHSFSKFTSKPKAFTPPTTVTDKTRREIMALTFGVPTTSSAYGVFQRQQSRKSAEIADARGEDGKVTDQQAFSKEEQVTGSFLVIAGGTLPEPGASAVLFGLTGLVTEITNQVENTNYKTGDITLSKKDAATQVAYA